MCHIIIIVVLYLREHFYRLVLLCNSFSYEIKLKYTYTQATCIFLHDRAPALSISEHVEVGRMCTCVCTRDMSK